MTKRENLFITLAIALAATPFYASADTQATTTRPMTEAQVFTACSQSAIEVRDNSIGSARMTYNLAMSAALSARKEGEKNAVAIEDEDKKRDAIKAAVDQYKQAVTSAQENLTKARKEAWNAFEANTNKCREVSKGKSGDKKSAVQTAEKTDEEEVKNETRSLKSSIIDSLKGFFRIGTGTTTSQ